MMSINSSAEIRKIIGFRNESIKYSEDWFIDFNDIFTFHQLLIIRFEINWAKGNAQYPNLSIRRKIKKTLKIPETATGI